MDKIQINIFDLLSCISDAQDLVSIKLSNHHQQVAYYACCLSRHLGLSVNQQYRLLTAGLIHDIGALSVSEKLEIIEKESVSIKSHAFRGAKLIESFKPLSDIAPIIKFHHNPWNNGEGTAYKGKDIPFESHIIHIADYICRLIRSDVNTISQVPDILNSVRKGVDTMFHPDLVEAVFDLSKNEYIWLDLTSRYSAAMIYKSELFNTYSLEIDDIVDLSFVFSHIIDFRSRFTSRHSAGVAKTAKALAKLMSFSPYECKMMLIAGYLHDLGKIAISDDILEKPSKLTVDEFNEMRAHTYYTYRLLEPMEQLKTINSWASFHHERLDGNGYPFHITGESLSLGSRIMAVADVFTAITENRPYRQGMDFDSTKSVLTNMVTGNALDGKVVNLLLDNYQEINNIRENAQSEAADLYDEFLLIDKID